MGSGSGSQLGPLGERHVRGRGEGGPANRELDCKRRRVVIGQRRGELELNYLLPRALHFSGAARGEGSSRESSFPFLVVAATAARGATWTLRRTTFGRGQPRSSYSSRSPVWSAWGNGCWRVRFSLRRALAEKPSARLGGARE